MEAIKVCSKCGKEKPLSEFHRNIKNKDGHNVWCKVCHHEYNYIWRAKNKDKTLGYDLQHLYGISLADYDEMLEMQDGGCAICGITPEEHGKRLYVDHDHGTGIIRGLLCQKCNSALGMLGDSLHLLHKAADYLEKFK